MQLEVIGINDSFWEGTPERTKSGFPGPVPGPTGPGTLVVSDYLVLGPVLGPVWEAGPGIESWCDRWYFKLLWCDLKKLQKTFRTGTQDTGQGPRSSLIATG